MELAKVLKKFESTITNICILKQAAKDQAKSELKAIERHRQVIESNPDLGLEEIPLSASNLLYRSAWTGELISFDYHTRNMDQSQTAVYIHKNKQYQWLLAEAYESFDRFLTEAYASVGLIDAGLWPPQDFGKISLPERDSLTWEQRVALLKEKRNRVGHILNQFRRRYPRFAKVEANNALQIDLRMNVTFCQKLRHHIIHDNGYIQDTEVLIAKVIKESAVTNANKKNDAADYIQRFIGSHEGENIISLLEVPASYHQKITFAYFDICDELIKRFVSHAHLLADCVNTNQTQ